MQFSYTDSNKNSKVVLNERRTENGTVLLDVEVAFSQPQIPQPLSVEWRVDCIDIYSTFQPGEFYNRRLGPTWEMRCTNSRLASGAPMHQLISAQGRNRMTAAVSDAQTPITIASGVDERTAQIRCKVVFFTQPVNYISDYRATIYIDLSDRRYEEALRAVHSFWEQCGYCDAYIPKAARSPMYSSWYAYHQEIDVDSIVEQCRMAKALGMDSVIVDDGWQIAWGKQGYITCGDWEVIPEKVPDMKEFVARIHALDMKFLLWFSVPFVGKESKAIERFADMTLDPKNAGKEDISCLDPRFPKVREYLVDIYKRAVEEWQLDGLKLDFIDAIELGRNTPAFDERWDTLSLEEGVDKLLDEVTKAVRAVNPEIMIEFRQTYYGPTICKYASMIRVSDCPEDAIDNHVRGINLRYSLNKTPAHSDMLMWHPGDTVESAAAQMISTLYLVPQISVLLDKIPSEHREMLAFWLSYWRENRETLLDGELSAEDPAYMYSQVKSELAGHAIVTAYTKTVYCAGSIEKLDFINASSGSVLYLELGCDCGEKSLRIFDCCGKLLEERRICFEKGSYRFDVPRCGIVRVE